MWGILIKSFHLRPLTGSNDIFKKWGLIILVKRLEYNASDLSLGPEKNKKLINNNSKSLRGKGLTIFKIHNQKYGWEIMHKTPVSACIYHDGERSENLKK